MSITYIPSDDELILRICPVGKRPSKKAGPLKLWWDAEANICAVSIIDYSNQLKEFEEDLGTTQLGGTWKGIKITSRDIKEVRKALLKKIEEKW